MKHRLLLLLLFMFATFAAGWAQKDVAPSFTIKGVLLDSLTQEGEPYATIRITKKGVPDKAVKMAVTGANGKFQEKLNVPAGDYAISISSIGKAPVVKDFTLKPSTKIIDLGTLYSSEANNELKGVEVVAQKPLVKVDVDKIEYNIEDDPDSKSNSILEMLRKVPLVTVDGEDNVQVNGSSSFKIHVNGKPNNMMSNNPKEVLKSMPANTIKYIEVITSPGAKYDAEGVGGILNIVTVGGGFEGYTATFRGNVSNNGAGAGTYAMVKQGKMTISVNYNYDYNNSPRSYSDNYRENYEPGARDEKFLESQSSSKSKGNFQHGNLEASYEIDTLRLLTAAFGMYGGSNESDNNGNTVMYRTNHEDVAYRYRTDSRNKNSWYSINGNIDYQRTSRKNKQRMLTLSYKINTQPQTDNSKNVYLDIFPDEQKEELAERLRLENYHSDGKTNTMEQTFQVDYTTPIGKLHTIETGAKYIFRRNSSDNALYEAAGGSDNYAYNEDRSSEYRHLNHILSAYAGYTLKYKDFSFKPGVRYEQTIQRVKYIVGPGEDFHTNYSDWVPSVSLGMKIGKTQNLRAGYNMRIWRPGIWNLNPYFNNQDPMSISQGNPDLKSEKSHAFDIAYSNFSAKFNINVSLRHSFGNNGIERVSRLITNENGEIFDDNPEHMAPNGAMYSTYDNIGKNRDTGLSLYLNWNASPKTRIYVNGRGSYRDLKSEAQGLHNYGWNVSCHGGIQHTLPLKIRLSLNGGGSTPYISLQGKGSGYQYYSIGLNRSFLKDDRLTLNLYCNNIFEKYRTYNSHTKGDNFISKSSGKYPNRYVGFSISYRIGELKASVKKAARSINNDDVKGGEGGGNAGGGGGQ
ncbi:outer membrane beta-barrel family protein [Bacteroides acidifaciens]|uniref:outer membrane beta-barrel family protein n=1 Tax=Bacteroides acidifaciens TaxID=85831 RepID=UPI003014B7ED